MYIKQFEDKNLSHFSYAILSEKQIVLVDPARFAKQYIDFAEEHDAQIVAIIETHPHADFVSSHLEIHQVTGAAIYISKLIGAYYPHHTFDEGQRFTVGKVMFISMNTPGHSPDSISIVASEEGVPKAVFTGDTLFIGDCGRPDLREGVGNLQVTRESLAKQMYYSLREKIMTLPDDIIVYPAHGAGSLCGKNLSKMNSSTIVEEKKYNWSLQPASEEEFVKNLLADQPFIPMYFPFDVEMNRKGALPEEDSIASIKMGTFNEISLPSLDTDMWVIDVRNEKDFKKGHLPHSINLMENGKFETWLGSIIKPGEMFYLAGENEQQLKNMMRRAAAIGYEQQIKSSMIISNGWEKEFNLDIEIFMLNENAFTIIDVRNSSEVVQEKIFANSISIPLQEIRLRMNEIPTDKPIVVHCAGGYRSAAASSLLHSKLNRDVKVYDLGEAIKQFSKS